MKVELGKRVRPSLQVCRSNYLPEIEKHAAIQAQNRLPAILEVRCGICQENRLDISRSAAPHIPALDQEEEGEESDATPLRHLPAYRRHSLERTMLLPCGHLFGHECLSHLITSAAHATPAPPSKNKAKPKTGTVGGGGSGGAWRCPACEAPSAHVPCGHAIPPLLLPIPASSSTGSAATAARSAGENGNDRRKKKKPGTSSPPPPSPLAAVGSNAPSRRRPCKDCVWKQIRAQLRIALSVDCLICRTPAAAMSGGSSSSPAGQASKVSVQEVGMTNGNGMLSKAEMEEAELIRNRRKEHVRHRELHLDKGLPDAVAEIIAAVWPPSDDDHVNAANNVLEKQKQKREKEEEDHRRQAMTSLVLTMALADLGDTIWCRRTFPDGGGGGATAGGGGKGKPGMDDNPLSGSRRREHDDGVEAIERQLLMCLMNPEDAF